ncbi:Uma2 family endonuclease [Leptothermofonsia sichuanensis E412]|uniref:Uma2 family endonuclease n=1 Tax=Leptothermofonsia sichuanensis TaxID=2917832 RepID=UPI001CA5FDFE|nr:Uma2 family endonuclease [Leptothermofonsia sichuanensis E412]
MMTPTELEYYGITIPPTQDELPYDDGENMESERHKLQMELLIDALLPWLNQREDGYVGGNMFVYYSMAQVRNQDFRGPDVFVALGVPKGERKSWVCWEEDKTPDVIIELLSDSTVDRDKHEKKLVYQNRMHVPEYFWYDPFNPEDWAGFRLVGGTYQPIAPNARGTLESEVLGLTLVRWQGVFKTIETTWLRWAYPDGSLLLTAEEQERQRAEQEHQRAEQERQRAEQERQRAEQAENQVQQIARNLLQAGLPIAQVAQMTGLAIELVEHLNQ